MTPQERQLVDDLFARLAQLERTPREPDAAAAINEGLRRAPNAIYALVQTVLLQEEALKRAHARLQEFEGEPPQQEPRGFLDSIPALRNRECVICGEGVAVPIRVAFDELAETRRPASSDPIFSDLWRDSGGEEGIIQRTIMRWRAQGK